MFRPQFLLPVVLLAGCSTAAVVKSAYPDREAYRLYSKVLEENVSYYCEPGESKAATTKRVNGAHRMFEAYIENASTGVVDAITSNDDFDKSDARVLAKQLEAKAEKLVSEMDAKYRCIYIE